MQWTFQITATPQPRLLARVLQLFDQQLLVVRSLTFIQTEAEIRIRISTAMEPALAGRLHAKLLHLSAVEDVQLQDRKNAVSVSGHLVAMSETSTPELH